MFDTFTRRMVNCRGFDKFHLEALVLELFEIPFHLHLGTFWKCFILCIVATVQA